MKGYEPVKTWERVGSRPPEPYETDLGTALVSLFERVAQGGQYPQPLAGGPGPTLGKEVETVTLLHELAGPGPVLELGVGNGRIARPLATTGIRVDGIDFSAAQIAKLRTMPGGERVSATVADMTDFALPDRYRVVYCVFNSLNSVLTQDGQVKCFEHAAAHLTDDGVFVLESYANLRWFSQLTEGQYVQTEGLQVDRAELDLVRVDPATQMLYEQHILISDTGIRLSPGVHRYTFPSEFDLMARIAGLRLVHRWGSWGREPFSASSPTVISVFSRR